MSAKHLLPWENNYFGNQHWTFQQDSAPAHAARLTQVGLKKTVQILFLKMNDRHTHFSARFGTFSKLKRVQYLINQPNL
jgi:putative flippase GtrA